MFFKNEDGTYKGGALRVYHGDVEEYWTHITPEFCNLLDICKIYWKSKFFTESLHARIKPELLFHLSCKISSITNL